MKLAHARWVRVRGLDDAEATARRSLDEAAQVLDVAFGRYLGAVELGPRFEYRKLSAIRDSIATLASDPAAEIHPDAMTPLV